MLENIDTRLFYLINKALANKALDSLMTLASDLAVNGFLPLVAVMLLFFKDKRDKITGILLLAGFTIEYHAVRAIKLLVARPRPFAALSDVRVLEGLRDFSFPSGHATIAFMAAVILSDRFRTWRPLFFSLAAIVAFSRVYLGAHFPSDVIAGAAFGSAIGYALVYASRVMQSSPNDKDDGTKPVG
jgi:undecaprenyl-diphosphatase